MSTLASPQAVLSVLGERQAARAAEAAWIDSDAACALLGLSKPTLCRLYTRYPDLRLSVERRSRSIEHEWGDEQGYLYARDHVRRLAELMAACELKPAEAVRVVIALDQGRLPK